MFFAFCIYSVPTLHFGNRMNLLAEEMKQSLPVVMSAAARDVNKMDSADSFAAITVSNMIADVKCDNSGEA